MVSTSKSVYEVAVLLFEGADILDFAGPMEMLSHFSYNNDIDDPERAFKMHTVAHSKTIHTGGCLTVNADMTLEEATNQIDIFDILVIPGGRPAVMKTLYESRSEESKFIEAFNKEAPEKKDKGDRLILSVCTGALLLGSTGALAGLTVTTHHKALDLLANVCQNASKGEGDAKPVKVVSKRYVDAGLNAAGIRVVTAGGISCGLDASLYVGSLKTSVQAAEMVRRVSEYDWKHE